MKLKIRKGLKWYIVDNVEVIEIDKNHRIAFDESSHKYEIMKFSYPNANIKVYPRACNVVEIE